MHTIASIRSDIIDLRFIFHFIVLYSSSLSPFKVLKFNGVSQDTDKLLEGWSLLVVPKQLFLWCLRERASMRLMYCTGGQSGVHWHDLNIITHLSEFLVNNSKFERVVDFVFVVCHYQLGSLCMNKNNHNITSLGRTHVRLTWDKLWQPPATAMILSQPLADWATDGSYFPWGRGWKHVPSYSYHGAHRKMGLIPPALCISVWESCCPVVFIGSYIVEKSGGFGVRVRELEYEGGETGTDRWCWQKYCNLW